MNIALIILGAAFILVVVLMMVSRVKAASAKPAMKTPTGSPKTTPVFKEAGENTSWQRPRDDTLSDAAFQYSPEPNPSLTPMETLTGSILTALPVPQTTGVNTNRPRPQYNLPNVAFQSTTQPPLSTSAPASQPFSNQPHPPGHYLIGLKLLARDPVGLKLLARDPVGLKLLARDPVGLRLLARDPVGLRLLARDPVGLKLLARDPVGLRLLARDPVGLKLLARDPVGLGLLARD